ncbi:hypothetical protein GM3708_136 [Geminocystis sp. NIES-3708]|uniref:HepT-like ribonuclease domain-containing protein n=1 Tax=Geminocystis sp. NIES-3708 TaxID=1615909 RepID=UPI0005FC972A|nr:HepT-like ribonuclease domain-containing protein [Geminocystis sp. NIES-3708]BAQ59731.1 hypothetical protein GM3708_136 [Geminocystis sp. NIES-3708]
MNQINKNYAFLWDMPQSCQRIILFIKNTSWEDYQNNILLQSAIAQHHFVIERQLEISGEAARRISPDFQQQNPQIPWSDIIGQRNIIAHQYEKINQKRIWQVITVDIPHLVIKLEKLISPLPPEY